MTSIDTERVGATPADDELRKQVCSVAIAQFGKRGFDLDLHDVADAAGVGEAKLTELFGSPHGLRQACNDLIEQTIRDAKSAALTSSDPADWFGQINAIDSYAPLMEYLARSLDAGDDLGRDLMHRMTENAERYLQDGVRAGTLKPTRDPKGRARLLAMIGGGSFLLYRRLHPTPDDMTAVLRDYSTEMLLPILELYTDGLMADRAVYDALLVRLAAGSSSG